jgi:hypothetical protein
MQKIKNKKKTIKLFCAHPNPRHLNPFFTLKLIRRSMFSTIRSAPCTKHISSVARVYANINELRPRSYWDYEALKVTWGYVMEKSWKRNERQE